MATPPDSPRFPKLLPEAPPRHIEFAHALRRRDWVIQQIGAEMLEPFELWAFRRSPYKPGQMVYDSHVTMHWQNSHSTKGVSEDTDQAVKDIIRIWISRFATDAKDSVILTSIDGAPCYSTGEDIPDPGQDREDI